MKTIGYERVKIGGFWGKIREVSARVSLPNIYARFEETGRFSALECKKTDPPSHIFYDSDVGKWLEGAAYLCRDYPDPALAKKAQKAVDRIVAAQLPCGYFNSFYQVYKPDKIFAERTEHELYCAGHLIEAAIALDESGLCPRLLPAMEGYADYIYERFFVKRDAKFVTCGHPEIELALARLFAYTKKEKYLTLAKFFLDERGTREEEIYAGRSRMYDQSHLPVREQREAVGHAVRALYLYTAMAEVGRAAGDETLLSAAQTLFENAVNTKMYLTGGTGASYEGENFAGEYELPNEYAYSETCSAIALALLCDRLYLARGGDGCDDVFERALYNNILAGRSWDGKAFFYTNPLEADLRHVRYAREQGDRRYQPLLTRKEVFDCSCCPPNLVRFFGRLGDFLYAEEGDSLFVRQYATSEVRTQSLSLKTVSELPYGGKVRFSVSGKGTLVLRIPAWCERYECEEGGKRTRFEATGKRHAFEVDGKREFTVDFLPRLRFVYANERVSEDAGRKAVTYGPLVLCAEGADNGGGLRTLALPAAEGRAERKGDFLFFTLPAERLRTGDALYSFAPPVREKTEATLIPYFLWANRGENDMQIWFL